MLCEARHSAGASADRYERHEHLSRHQAHRRRRPRLGGILAGQANAAGPPAPAASANPSDLLALKAPAPLPATWLELSKLDAQLSRDAEQAMSKVTSELARISGYVSARDAQPRPREHRQADGDPEGLRIPSNYGLFTRTLL
jgi:hypothetical protein